MAKHSKRQRKETSIDEENSDMTNEGCKNAHLELESDSSNSSSDEETEKTLFRPSSAQNPSDAEIIRDQDHQRDVRSTKVERKKVKKTKSVKDDDTVEDQDLLVEEVAQKVEATIYVEGIPYDCDEGDIVTHFSPCGIVKEVRLPRYQDSGRPRGYAHVLFESASSIPGALKMDKKYLKRRYLSVRKAEKPRSVELALEQQKQANISVNKIKGCRTVFIKQLPYDIEEDQVKQALQNCGNIVSVRLPLWNDTKKLKGFGYVEFEKEESALQAVKKSGMKIGNRMALIQLETTHSGPKASFRKRDGQYWIKGEESKKLLGKRLAEKSRHKVRKVASSKRP